MMNYLNALFGFSVILMSFTAESYSKDLFEKRNQDAKLNLQIPMTYVQINKNPVLLTKTVRAQPNDTCPDGAIDSGCDATNLLLCIEQKCTCPVMDHDQVLKLIGNYLGRPIELPPGVTSEFALNTTWANEKCVGNNGSFCIANLPSELEGYIPYKFTCASGLGCAAYPDKELQGVLGRCGASTVFVTSALFLATLITYFL